MLTFLASVITALIGSGVFSAFITKKLDERIKKEEKHEHHVAELLKILDEWRMSVRQSAADIYMSAMGFQRTNEAGRKAQEENVRQLNLKRFAAENAVGQHFPDLLQYFHQTLGGYNEGLTELAGRLFEENEHADDRAKVVIAQFQANMETDETFDAFKKAIFDKVAKKKASQQVGIAKPLWKWLVEIVRPT